MRMQTKSLSSVLTLLAAGAAMLSLPLLSGCTADVVNPNMGKNSAPTVLTQPTNQTVLPGQAAAFSVTVVAYGPVTYQWYMNGTAVAGATNNVFIVSAVTAAMNGTTVYVVATGAEGSVKSVVVTLNVSSAISGGGGTTTATAALSCTPVAPAYGATVTLVPTFSAGTAELGSGGAKSSDVAAKAVSGTPYTTEPVTSAQTYTLTVVGAGGSGDTSVTTATCKAVPTAVSVSNIQPAGSTMGPGTVSFSATVSGGVTNTLNWSASDGSFAGNTWTSPSAAGTYTITATSADNPAIHATTTVTVSAPAIVKQPVSVAACANAATTLAVSANYAASYQWYLGGVAIPGAVASSYLVPSASAMDAGSYTVSVGNAAGSAMSQAATLSVGSTITANPVNATVGLLQPATFTVAAQGKSPFTYQWYVQPAGAASFTAIPGATVSSYSTTAVSDSGGNQYEVVVKDGCGASLTSTPATLSLKDMAVPPIITQQPVSQAVGVGGSVTFRTDTATATASTYQWYRVPAGAATGTAIAGANASSYTVPGSATNVSNDQDGYYLVVSNAAGSDVSATATVAVGQGILIRAVDQPQTVEDNVGDTAVFAVNAISTLPLTYQWYQAAPGSSSFAAIAGATQSSYTIPSTTADMSGSSLYVVVSNGTTASVTSTKAGLLVGQYAQATNLCDAWTGLGYGIQQASCTYQLVPAKSNVAGAVMWPRLVPTSNVQLSFTVSIANPSATPGEGFAIVFGDPSLGAGPKSLGSTGLGLGAAGIPGYAITFNTDSAAGGPKPPFLGTTFSAASQWGNPWMDTNTTLTYLAAPSATVTHTFNVSVLNDAVDVLMDGVQVFHGDAALPPVAYLYFTAANGTNYEQVNIGNLTAIFSPQ